MTTSEKTETHTQKPRPNTHKNKTQAKSHQMKAYLLKMAASLTTKRCVRDAGLYQDGGYTALTKHQDSVHPPTATVVHCRNNAQRVPHRQSEVNKMA